MGEIIIPKASETPVTETASYSRKSDVFFWDKLPELLVYVEDNEDMPFWRRVFSCIEDKRRITVSVIKRDSKDAIMKRKEGDDEVKGKDVLMRVPDLSDRKVVAVDADYDLLVDYHNYSERVRSDKYVIHTEYYSIENHLLQASTIKSLSIWENLASFMPDIDWDDAFNKLAEAVSDAVRLCVASTVHRQNLYHRGLAALPDTYSVKEISSALGDTSFAPDNYAENLRKWRANIESSAHYKVKFKESAEEMRCFSDWTADDVLHNLQGHTLYNFVFQLLSVCFNSSYNAYIDNAKKNVTDKAQLPTVIKDLRQRVGIGDGFIKSSIYSASELDMSDCSIAGMQEKVRKILD